MSQKSYTTFEEDINPVISYTSDEFFEQKLVNLLEQEQQSHTYLTFEQVFESEDTREVFTGIYKSFTNPHSVITPKHLQTLY